jgi:protein-S-isoprenylcysteine O-methyltransferase Ste14
MIALGRFAFRFRNLLFPLILVGVLAISTPRDPLGDPAYDVWMDLAGTLVVLLGLSVRAITIGYEYIVRGGRGKQVYADHLVQGGIYAHTRNPMYLGNALILLGLALVINAPVFYLLALPLTALMYGSIIAAEEAYLREKFGAGFDDYCARVNRLFPRLSGFRRSVEGMRFNWRRVVVKDYSTVFASILGIVLLDWWHDYGINGTLVPWSADHQAMTVFLVAWGLLFIVVWRLKKSRWIEGDVPDAQRRA